MLHAEASTLYKLMILYMLKEVNFPMEANQLSCFFTSHEYTSYVQFHEVLKEMLESALIKSTALRETVVYEISHEGENALYYFGSKISDAAKKDMDLYIKEQQFSLRSEVGVMADYVKKESSTVGGSVFLVHCEIREGNSPLFCMDISVSSEMEAEAMCAHWEKMSQEIYSDAIKKLLG